MLVSCAFYFRYKSLPSPVSLVDCDKYKKINYSNQKYNSSHELAILFVIIVSAAVIVLGLEALFLYFVFNYCFLRGYQAIYVRPCKLQPDSLKAYSS